MTFPVILKWSKTECALLVRVPEGFGAVHRLIEQLGAEMPARRNSGPFMAARILSLRFPSEEEARRAAALAALLGYDLNVWKGPGPR